MTMPTVSLDYSVGTGIIIACESGVLISNQTGGTSCLHPAIEGVYFGIANDYTVPEHVIMSPELALTDYFEGPKHGGAGATDGIDPEDADFIDALLKKSGLFPDLAVDREKLQESQEAWVHIVIRGESDFSSYSKLRALPAGRYFDLGQ